MKTNNWQRPVIFFLMKSVPGAGEADDCESERTGRTLPVSQVVWELSHSIETEASLAFAWAYMTDVANWSDPPAEFELEGPFVAGSHGITRTPGQEPRHWQLREVIPMKSYSIEAPLDRATISFEWRFEGLTEGRTRLTQRITLGGENAAAFLEQVQEAFAASLPAGMTRIATAMARAHDAGSA